jgi:4-hydroxythreonine-4-phosphate dehydrogenase
MTTKNDTAFLSREPRRPTLGVTMGDPCGVGPELVLRALADERVHAAARLLVIGDERRLRNTARELKLRWPFGTVCKTPPQSSRWDRPQLLDLENVAPDLEWGLLSAQAGTAAGEGLERAVELATGNVIDGLVTAPIHKEALSLAGYTDAGPADLLGRLAGARRIGVLFWGDVLSVGLFSTHVSLREAARRVRAGRVLDSLQLFDEGWRRYFGKAPRIAVAALNPHGSQNSRFGTEEDREIRPAVEKAREKGLLVSGPIAADTVFGAARAGAYDLVLALYHDQAAVPFKLLHDRRGVTLTFGLPFLRTSVEHGPAFDIAGKGLASAEGLVRAIIATGQLLMAERHEAIAPPPPQSGPAP